jgi:hypothetical protein
MPVPQSAHQLRQRAAALRRLMLEIDRSPVMQLDALAGEDTWSFPAAERCRELLAADVQALHQVVEDLRSVAWRLEQAADALAAADVIR